MHAMFSAALLFYDVLPSDQLANKVERGKARVRALESDSATHKTQLKVSLYWPTSAICAADAVLLTGGVTTPSHIYIYIYTLPACKSCFVH